MIYSLLLLTIYIWPFGQLLTFSNPTIPFSIYFLDVSVFFLFTSLVLSQKRKIIFSGPIVKPLVVFLGIATLSLLLNLNQAEKGGSILSIFYLLRLIMYPSIFFAVKHVGIKRLKTLILISIIIFTFLCLTQYLLFPDMRFLKYLGFDDHYFRLIGSFYDPNFTGIIFVGISLFLIFKKKIMLSLPIICLLAITFSRASYLAFIVGLIIILISQKKFKLFLLLIFLLAIIYFTPKPFGEGVNLLRTFSIYSRLESWQQGLSLFFQKPIFGWGYNTLRGEGGSRFQVDNSYIFLLATTGIAGFLSFINLLKKLNQTTKDTGIKLLIFSLLFHSFFNNSLFFIWITALFWLSLGIGQEETTEYKTA